MPRSNARIIVHNGEALSVAEWSRRLGIPYGLLYGRLEAGWSDEAAITRPARPAPVRAPRKTVTYEGREVPIAALAKAHGMKPVLLEVRLAKGWPLAKALRPGRCAPTPKPSTPPPAKAA